MRTSVIILVNILAVIVFITLDVIILCHLLVIITLDVIRPVFKFNIKKDIQCFKSNKFVGNYNT
jgi:hypothetical protein